MKEYLLNSHLDNNANCENIYCDDCPLFRSEKIGIRGRCSDKILKIMSVLGIHKTPPINPQNDYSLYNCGEVFNWLIKQIKQIKQIKYEKLDIE